MRKFAVAAFVVAILLFAGVAGGDDKVGTIVWQKEVQGEVVAKITKRLGNTGLVEFEIWTVSRAIYQEYPLVSTGYSGAPIRFVIREVRPHQQKSDAARGLGMRDPSTLYRAAHIEWGARMDRDDGSTLFIEVRSVSQNYLIVLTEIYPVPDKPAEKPTKLGSEEVSDYEQIIRMVE